MATEPLVIWRLTDGKPGHMQQTLGLAHALSAQTPCEIIDIDVAATRVGVRDFLLGRFTPGFAKKRPHLILGAGHATHFALLAARRAAGGLAVVLMKPTLPSFLFDLVIIPEHDNPVANERVVVTRGMLNPMQPSAKKTGSLLFLIGGPSKHIIWDDAKVLAQLSAVIAILTPGTSWRIADSRRTPDSLRDVLRLQYTERFQPWQECPPGWLAERLANTETVWVSEDSISMVYEALTAGCRVGLLQLEPALASNRLQTLINDSLITTFDGWSRTHTLCEAGSFNEAERVARLLLERLMPARILK
jgi:mitochondrial fission protein ELM1